MESRNLLANLTNANSVLLLSLFQALVKAGTDLFKMKLFQAALFNYRNAMTLFLASPWYIQTASRNDVSELIQHYFSILNMGIHFTPVVEPQIMANISTEVLDTMIQGQHELESKQQIPGMIITDLLHAWNIAGKNLLTQKAYSNAIPIFIFCLRQTTDFSDQLILLDKNLGDKFITFTTNLGDAMYHDCEFNPSLNFSTKIKYLKHAIVLLESIWAKAPDAFYAKLTMTYLNHLDASRNPVDFKKLSSSDIISLLKKAIAAHAKISNLTNDDQKFFCSSLNNTISQPSIVLTCHDRCDITHLLIAEYTKIPAEKMTSQDIIDLAQVRFGQINNYTVQAKSLKDTHPKTLAILKSIYDSYNCCLLEFNQIPNDIATSANRMTFENCLNDIFISLLDVAMHHETLLDENIINELQCLYHSKIGSNKLVKGSGLNSLAGVSPTHYELCLKLSEFAAELAKNNKFDLAVEYYDMTLSLLKLAPERGLHSQRYQIAQVNAAYHYFLTQQENLEHVFNPFNSDMDIADEISWQVLGAQNISILMMALKSCRDVAIIPGEHLNLIFWVLKNIIETTKRFIVTELTKIKNYYPSHSVTLFTSNIPECHTELKDFSMESLIKVATQHTNNLENNNNTLIQTICMKLHLLKSLLEILTPVICRLSPPEEEKSKPRTGNSRP